MVRPRSTLSGYDYDFAVSFAGEKRSFAGRLVRGLEKAGTRVFFSDAERGRLWGKDENEFRRVFGPASRFIIPIISAGYVRKDWPRFEYESAMDEAKRRNDAGMILPIRLDDSRMVGLRGDKQYLHAANTTVPEMVTFALQKLTDARSERPVARRISAQNTLQLYADSTRRAAHLLASMPLPLPPSGLKQLFPDITWDTEIARLSRFGWIEREGVIGLTQAARRSLAEARTDHRKHLYEWVRILTPLSGHVDTGLCLAVQLAKLGRLSAAMNTIIPLATNVEPGHWNSILLTFMETANRRAALNKLSRSTRLRFRNALGLALSREGRYSESRKVFTSLVVSARKARSTWLVGQALINGGVVAVELGDRKGALRLSKAAIDHARRTRDQGLLGRALNNHGQLLAERQSHEAEAMLKESLRVKKEVGDLVGIPATLVGLGNLLVNREDLVGARHRYEQAVGRCIALDLRFEQCLSSRNLAHVWSDRGKPTRALAILKRALAIAKREGFQTEALSLQDLEANVEFRAERFEAAERSFAALAVMQDVRKNFGAAALAYRNAAAMSSRCRRMVRASALLREAERRAALAGDLALRARCVMEEGVILAKREQGGVARLLHRAIVLAANASARNVEREARAHLARLYRKEEKTLLADDQLRALFLLAPQAERNGILIERLRLLTQGKRWRRVGGVFKEIQAVLRRESDAALAVNAHMIVADALWMDGPKSAGVEAIRAYLVALLESVALGVKMMLKVGGHAAVRIAWQGKGARTDRLDAIERQASRWLKKSSKGRSPEEERFLVWPIRVAQAIRMAYTPPARGLTARGMTAILEKEVGSFLRRKEGRSDRRGSV